MLTHLSIINYAIIEQLELSFSNGFTVVTGETGAGKSILLGALSMILGQRADTGVLKDKDKKCIVEGQFELAQEDFLEFFSRNDLDFESTTILRRELNNKGKSRAFINDTPVTLNLIKELVSRLIDIHSQHQTLQIKNNAFQTNVLDAFAGNSILFSDYQRIYQNYKKELQKLNELQNLASNSSADNDYLQFQVKEIEELGLKSNEKEELEKELAIINNAEEIKNVLNISDNILSNSEISATQLVKEAEQHLLKISGCSTGFKELYERFRSINIELDDITNEIANYNDSFSFNPEDLNYLNERLGKIYALEQKHRVNSTEEILERLSEFKQQLKEVDSYDEKVLEQQQKVNYLKDQVYKLAGELSVLRNKFKKQLEENVTAVIAELGMSDAEFVIQLSKIEEPNELGVDGIEFLFSANKGIAPQQLSKVASGGELSRLMLTFKSILVKTKKLPTIIFDEIDTGVSGDIAEKMAEMMDEIAVQSQVISITHLPQVAAKGNEHFKVYKHNKNDKTLTSVSKLKEEERVEELAKMLSGRDLTAEARENAKVLLRS